jgi:hypothetical protein
VLKSHSPYIKETVHRHYNKQAHLPALHKTALLRAE